MTHWMKSKKNKTHIIIVYDNEVDEFENIPNANHNVNENETKYRKNCIGVLTLEDIIEYILNDEIFDEDEDHKNK